jgi:hypothetical protein
MHLVDGKIRGGRRDKGGDEESSGIRIDEETGGDEPL